MWVIYDIKSSRALGVESFYGVVDGENPTLNLIDK